MMRQFAPYGHTACRECLCMCDIYPCHMSAVPWAHKLHTHLTGFTQHSLNQNNSPDRTNPWTVQHIAVHCNAHDHVVYSPDILDLDLLLAPTPANEGAPKVVTPAPRAPDVPT
mmetsp:Transcript_24084/g.52649  ORF Transcript_24084/g.52649 Transcript_24084/m.52649 type:complete len:113 (-) Transcript_24084:298-636(-)